jgi:hypothetical protein
MLPRVTAVLGSRRFGAAIVSAFAIALLGAADASAVTRYAAPGGTATPAQCISPDGPYCSIGTAAAGTGVLVADEVVILPGNYSDSAGDLDGDVLSGQPTDGTVNPSAGSVHGLLGAPRPVITIDDPLNPWGAFFLGAQTLRHVTIANAVSNYNLTMVGSGGVVDGVIARNTRDAATVIACNHSGGTVRNSVCSTTGSGAVALGSDVGTGGTPNPIVRGVTATSSGTGSFGLHYRFHSFSPGTGPTATVSAKSVIAQGALRDVRARATGTAQTSVTINLDHSAFDSSDALATDGATASATPAGTGAPNFNVTAAPLLASDGYHQLAGSPTINAGQTDASSGTSDIDGQARQIGLQPPDIGADEAGIPTEVSVDCAPASVPVGGVSTCTATVSEDTASFINGEVAFESDSPGTFSGGGSCDLVSSPGEASCELTFTPSTAGTHQITASYAGGGNHDPSQDTTMITVLEPTSTALSCPAQATVGQAASCTATVSSAAGFPTGSVNFAATGGGSLSAPSCTLALLTGAAACKVAYTPSQAGAHQITATYLGAGEHAGSQGTTALQANPAATPPAAKKKCKKGFKLKKIKTKSGKVKKKCVRKKRKKR